MPARLSWTGTARILRIAFDDRGDLIVDGDRVVAGHHVVQRARLKVDTVKWIMAKLAPKRYGDRPEITEQQQAITIQWQATDAPKPPIERAPPKQLVYRQPEMPADLQPQDWSVLMQVLELLKRTVPSNDDRPPAEIFEVLRKALLAHFKEKEIA